MDKTEHVATHLARNLAALRHVRTLTQGALAKSSGLPRSTIANLESGVGNPSLAVLPKVAGERNDLVRGDVLAFPGNVPHSYQNPDATRGARGVSVVILAKAGV